MWRFPWLAADTATRTAVPTTSWNNSRALSSWPGWGAPQPMNNAPAAILPVYLLSGTESAQGEPSRITDASSMLQAPTHAGDAACVRLHPGVLRPHLESARACNERGRRSEGRTHRPTPPDHLLRFRQENRILRLAPRP